MAVVVVERKLDGVEFHVGESEGGWIGFGVGISQVRVFYGGAWTTTTCRDG